MDTIHSVVPIATVINGNESKCDLNNITNYVSKENDHDTIVEPNILNNTNAQENLETKDIDVEHITNTQDIDETINDLSNNLNILKINTIDVTDTEYMSRENPELPIDEHNHVDASYQIDLVTPNIDDKPISDHDPGISTSSGINTPNIDNDNAIINTADNFDPDLLTTAKFRPSRRSSIMKSLKYEIFTFNAYKNENQAGMITDDPCLWTKALQMYTKIKNANHRWELIKEKKENKCSEFILHLIFRETKRIIISIKLITGIINIKGAHIKEWVANEFDPVKECVDTLRRDETRPPITTSNNTNESMLKLPPTEAKTENSAKENKKDKENDIDDLWEENSRLKNALKILETSITAKPIAPKNEDSEIINKRIDSTITEKLQEAEKRLDAKIIIFQEEIEKTFQAKIKNIEQSFADRLYNLSEKITKLNTHLEDEANGAYYSIQTECDTLHQRINSHIQSCSLIIKPDLSHEHSLDDHNKSTPPNGNDNVHAESTQHDITKTSLKINENNEIQPVVISVNEIPQVNNEKIEERQNHTDYIQISSPELTNITSTNRPQSNETTPNHNGIVEALENLAPANNTEERPIIPPTDNSTELIIMMDSNIKFIEYRRLWTTKNTIFTQCGNLDEVERTLNGKKYLNLKYILINVGVNDIDENNGTQVFDKISKLVQLTKQKHVGIKIILAEITPRKDDRNREVIKCNVLINELARRSNNIFIAKHENLKDEQNSPKFNRFLYDEKHIKKNCIGRFVKNLKIALCKAYGIEHDYQGNRDQEFRHSYPNQQQQQRNTKYSQNYHQQQTYNFPTNFTNHNNEHYNQYDYPPTRGIHSSYQSETTTNNNTGNPNVNKRYTNVHHKNDIDMEALKISLRNLLTMVDVCK